MIYNTKSFFFNKKILIYGLGKSGMSAFNFLQKKNDIFVFDDDHKSINDQCLPTVLFFDDNLEAVDLL